MSFGSAWRVWWHPARSAKEIAELDEAHQRVAERVDALECELRERDAVHAEDMRATAELHTQQMEDDKRRYSEREAALKGEIASLKRDMAQRDIELEGLRESLKEWEALSPEIDKMTAALESMALMKEQYEEKLAKMRKQLEAAAGNPTGLRFPATHVSDFRRWKTSISPSLHPNSNATASNVEIGSDADFDPDAGSTWLKPLPPKY